MGRGAVLAPPSVASPSVQPPSALYIHVPFCRSICPYCDFVVYAGLAASGHGSRMPAFLAALHVELDLRADQLDARWGSRPAPLRSVYLGGGTPSLLSAAEIAELLAHVERRLGLAVGAEITLEANPGPSDRGDLAGFVAAGVTRLSFGVQSFQPDELKRLGRRHSPGDAVLAVGLARAAGVASLNIDLLYDLPGATEATWRPSLETALTLEPDHLSLYALTVDDAPGIGSGESDDHLPVRPGARRWRERARAEQDDDRAAEQYTMAVERLAAAGFRGYEISNWARPGHESRHNQIYWQRHPFEAIGPGAHAFDGANRRWNAAALGPWLVALGSDPARLPPGGSEAIDERTARAETLMLGLRLDTGIDARALDGARFGAALQWGLSIGLLARSSGGRRLALTTRGRLLSNELFARLL